MHNVGDRAIAYFSFPWFLRKSDCDSDFLAKEGKRHTSYFAPTIAIGDRESRRGNALHKGFALKTVFGHALDVFHRLDLSRQHLLDGSPDMVPQSFERSERHLVLAIAFLAFLFYLIEHPPFARAIR